MIAPSAMMAQIAIPATTPAIAIALKRNGSFIVPVLIRVMNLTEEF